MQPDIEPTHEQTVTRFEEPGNVNLEPVPPLIPEKVVTEWVQANPPSTD
jgi:hypothetical protein